jgi:lipopolysaccharide/colanic/teichoic acid biosynthesis glycosyltransferase
VKRLFDLAVASVLLVLTSPVLLAATIALRATSGPPVLYRARRSGKDGREFVMYKLRTMRPGAGPSITATGDPRITRLGSVLRRTRLDELPQLWNVIRGDMSLVGPRPEDPRFVALYTPEQRAVLSVAPGLTGPAQLEFRREEEMLPSADPETAYIRDVLPRKLDIDLAYVRGRSFRGDLGILARTAAAIFGARRVPAQRSTRR